MKRNGALICVLWLLSVALVYGDDTAYQALKVIKNAKGEDMLKNLVELEGEGGDPQPTKWKALFNDASARGGVREIVVDGGELSSERTPLRGFAGVGDMPAISSTALNVDSDKVFHIAESQAVKSKVGFHRLDYMLKADPAAHTAVWKVQLYDKMGAMVGKMEISAANGSIVKPLIIDADYHPVASSHEEEESSSYDSWKSEGGLFGKVKSVTERTGDSIKHTTLKVGGTVQEFLTGERTIDGEN
ncbi:MAG: hypothetical protein ABI443_04405 [Chthoniobacterales bacterium]